MDAPLSTKGEGVRRLRKSGGGGGGADPKTVGNNGLDEGQLIHFTNY